MSDKVVSPREISFEEIFDITDQFGLFFRIEVIARVLAIYELIKQTLNLPGNIFEFGCYKGSNLLFMARVLKLLQPNTIKEVYGFESFEGLRTFCEKDNVNEIDNVETYKADEKTLRNFIKLYKMEDWVHLVVGDATKTIKEFESKYYFLINFAYLDFDLYLPTKEALKFVHKRLSVGGLIVFDEALTSEWEGESRAMLEFLDENPSKYEMSCIPFSKQPTVALKRIG